jgi:hypothetical protein
VRPQDLVEYIGPAGKDPFLHRGSPGQVWSVDRIEFGEVYVTYAFGPSICTRPDDLRPLDEAEYDRRAGRLKQGLHPLEDRQVATLAGGYRD